MKSITVTELARGLSDIINRANYRGESFVVTRGGKAVAQICPAPAGTRAKDLGAVFESLPRLAAGDVERFSDDLAEVRKLINEPVRDAWDS